MIIKELKHKVSQVKVCLNDHIDDFFKNSNDASVRTYWMEKSNETLQPKIIIGVGEYFAGHGWDKREGIYRQFSKKDFFPPLEIFLRHLQEITPDRIYVRDQLTAGVALNAASSLQRFEVFDNDEHLYDMPTFRSVTLYVDPNLKKISTKQSGVLKKAARKYDEKIISICTAKEVIFPLNFNDNSFQCEARSLPASYDLVARSLEIEIPVVFSLEQVAGEFAHKFYDKGYDVTVKIVENK